MIDDPTDAVSHGHGKLVAAVLESGETVQDLTRPKWCDKLDTATQDKIIDADDVAGDVVAITRAGGSVVAAAWAGQRFDSWHVSAGEEDWIRAEAARRKVQS